MDELQPSELTPKHPKWLDRQLLLALLLLAAVLIPRGLYIAHEHSASCDDNYHLYRGLLFLRLDRATLKKTIMNDPPLGEAISAIPAWLNGINIPNPEQYNVTFADVAPPSDICFRMPQRVEYETAIWKTLLFIPCAAMLFQWVRQIYSLKSAWLLMGMLIVEPTLAGHLPLPSLDVLATEGILFGCWAGWRFVNKPTVPRTILAASATAFAMLLKHTALILPGVILVYGLIHWLIRLRLLKNRTELWRNSRLLMLFLILIPAAIWILMLGDLSVPMFYSRHPIFGTDFANWGFVPAGIYIQSLYDGFTHAGGISSNYLWSQFDTDGWWYYFPAVATYKIPLGLCLLGLMAAVSFTYIPLRYGELPLIVSAAIWLAALMTQHVNIGFRHALPVEFFLLMLTSRFALNTARTAIIGSWACILWTAIDVGLWTPDYAGYINFPRTAYWLDISDSNVDWGQGLKQLKRWIDARQDNATPIYVSYFGETDNNLYDWLGPSLTEYTSSWSVHWLKRPDANNPDLVKYYMPDHGILVISMASITGQYDPTRRFHYLGLIPPDEIIGHAMLVYDLDRLRREGKLPQEVIDQKTAE